VNVLLKTDVAAFMQPISRHSSLTVWNVSLGLRHNVAEFDVGM